MFLKKKCALKIESVFKDKKLKNVFYEKEKD